MNNEKYQERYREKKITIMDLFQRIHVRDISQDKILLGGGGVLKGLVTMKTNNTENFWENIPCTVFYHSHFPFIAGGLGWCYRCYLSGVSTRRIAFHEKKCQLQELKRKEFSDKDNYLIIRRANTVTYRTHIILFNNIRHLIS
jgi:hypothetical protein